MTTDAVPTPEQVAATRTDVTPPPLLATASEAVAKLEAAWAKPDAAVSTGLHQLDAVLAGGLRPGNLVAITAAAKAGKSALFGQVAYEAAKRGAIFIYASAEMSDAEVAARYVVREMFLRAEESDWAVSYSDVLYGKARRGELCTADAANERVRKRLEQAAAEVANHERFYIKRLPLGATPKDLRSMVEEARAKHPSAPGDAPRLAVLLVDPLQRLYGSKHGAIEGRALDTLNANETQRVGHVAGELKAMADDAALNLAILFTSDTTKSAAANNASSVVGLRGSYELNHWATHIFGLVVAPTDDELAEKLSDYDLKDFKEWADQLLKPCDRAKLPDAALLGLKVAFLECSGSRAAAASHSVFYTVPGAMCFLEGSDAKDTVAANQKNTVTGPKRRQWKGGKD